jgi:hypothetical protein
MDEAGSIGVNTVQIFGAFAQGMILVSVQGWSDGVHSQRLQAVSAEAQAFGLCQKLSTFRLRGIDGADQVEFRKLHFVDRQLRNVERNLVSEGAQRRPVALPENPNGPVFPGGEPPPVGISSFALRSQLLALTIEQGLCCRLRLDR